MVHIICGNRARGDFRRVFDLKISKFVPQRPILFAQNGVFLVREIHDATRPERDRQEQQRE